MGLKLFVFSILSLLTMLALVYKDNHEGLYLFTMLNFEDRTKNLLVKLPFFISLTSSSMTMAGSAVTRVKSCGGRGPAPAASLHGDGAGDAAARGPVTSLRFGPRKRRMMTDYEYIASLRSRWLL